ncbi:Monomeric sarcosine oxidase [Candidatus Entotheonellaceae bacterium PAL068K]
MNDTTYDYIVIGKGLMGTAAARHLSATSQRLALIGPDEPANRSSHRGIFGSHYDEGRITRILDPDHIWALLAQRSLARYREVEAQSGIAFYREVGHLMVAPQPSRAFDFVSRVQRVAAHLGVEYETYTDAGLARRFPYLAFEPGSVGLYQPHTAGYVSPRSQVRAQATAAQKQGATLIAETVDRLHQTAGHVEVHTDAGQTYQATQVLLATGGFYNAKGLLPRPLDIAVHARTIILLELGATDAARLHGMPSIIYTPRDPAGHCYILPPIRYPNGKTYLKIGGHPNDPTLDSLAALQGWFRGPGDPAAAQHLTAKLQGIVRHLQPLSMHSDSCVTTHTPGEQVYATRLEGGRLGVLVGGNGRAAKSADEIGRLGALMMAHEEWAYDIEAHHFQVQFARI